MLATDSSPPPAEVFQQIGLITRQLHDTLQHLGVMPKLQQAATGLPDARSRLSYIADKCGDAANRVLNSVDQAKNEQLTVADATRRIEAAITRGGMPTEESSQVLGLLGELEAARGRTDGHLTDIMLAQDYHDLTGQVVARVVALAIDLEDGLVKLLVQAAPAEQVQKVDSSILDGPVVNPAGRADVVADQGEVDDLLASLGF
ncbi:MAG: protein phosphatase CheZ [Caldimonas sp.]